MYRFDSACVELFCTSVERPPQLRLRRLWHRAESPALRPAPDPRFETQCSLVERNRHARHLPHFPLRPPSRRRIRPAAAEPGPMPDWNLADLYPAPDAPRPCKRDLKKAAEEAARHQERYQGKLAELGARRGPAGGGHRGLREPERHHRQARVVRRACSTPPTQSNPDESQVLRRHPGEAHRHLDRPDLLRAGAQPDRRGAAGARAAGARRWRATSRGSTTCARRSPISWTSSWSACSTRSR